MIAYQTMLPSNAAAPPNTIARSMAPPPLGPASPSAQAEHTTLPPTSKYSSTMGRWQPRQARAASDDASSTLSNCIPPSAGAGAGAGAPLPSSVLILRSVPWVAMVSDA